MLKEFVLVIRHLRRDQILALSWCYDNFNLTSALEHGLTMEMQNKNTSR